MYIKNTAHGQVSATVKPNNVREFTPPWEKYNRKPRLPVNLRRRSENLVGQGGGGGGGDPSRPVPRVQGPRTFRVPEEQSSSNQDNKKVTTAVPGNQPKGKGTRDGTNNGAEAEQIKKNRERTLRILAAGEGTSGERKAKGEKKYDAFKSLTAGEDERKKKISDGLNAYHAKLRLPKAGGQFQN